MDTYPEFERIGMALRMLCVGRGEERERKERRTKEKRSWVAIDGDFEDGFCCGFWFQGSGPL